MIPKTKIIATLGPASTSGTIIRKMFLSGLDVVRLNFSHGTVGEHISRWKTVMDINRRYRRHIRVLQDLEGYRIRIGKLPNGRIELKKRQTIQLVQSNSRRGLNCIPFDYKGDLKTFRRAKFIYIDDGNLELEIIGISKNTVTARVVIGGILREHKGINIPSARFSFSGLTEKDKRDLKFAVSYPVDFIAQSFVRNADDMDILREHLKRKKINAKIIAKIENREGIRNIEEIISASDGIMIARGDMGVSLPICEIPLIQKNIISRCNKRKKTVITATQMLESMVEHSRPTRAEVTDVANAIFDGTDYVMLSAETAAGQYPVEAVSMMNDIIKCTEQSTLYHRK